MAVRIRLTRRGRKKKSIYDVIVADSRSPRDGRFIEKIGTYNPLSNPASIELNDDKALEWLLNGAQPSETVKAMLSYRGVLLRKHLQIGVLKGAIPQEVADARFLEWKNSKDSQIQSKVDKLSKAKADKSKQQLEAEIKINKARTESLLAKKREAEAALTAAVAQASSSEEDASASETAE